LSKSVKVRDPKTEVEKFAAITASTEGTDEHAQNPADHHIAVMDLSDMTDEEVGSTFTG